ncbi:MAG: DoxX family membrane protein [Acidobacteria bacterium]|nr:DoxX family membrane protein [Acidobacteriota bacterium]
MPSASANGLRLLSAVLGIFLISMGFGKLDWAADSSLLENELRNWWGPAPAISKLYIDWFAMPLHPILARLVLLGELTTGLALVAGYRLRMAALAALFMILNFHFAMGLLFSSEYLTNGYALPVVGGLVALVVGARGLPYSLDR